MRMNPRLGDALRAWRRARPRPLPAREHDQVIARARLERHGGLLALYLAGTPYEMGYQHGVLARDEIHAFRQAAYSYVTTLIPGPVGLTPPARLARALLFHQAAAYWPTILPHIAQEMRGIAAGAGVHPIEVLTSTAIWEMFLASGCSQFAALAATDGGSLIHGYNYDLMHPDHALIQPYLTAVFYRPQDGIPFVTVNTVGSVGANAGMNEAGISLAWDNAPLRDDSLVQGIQTPVVPFTITLRQVLQQSHTLAEAAQTVVGSLPRPHGDIVIIGCAPERRAIALETAGGEYAEREMDHGAIWSTNCFRSPLLAPHDRRGGPPGLTAAGTRRRLPRYAAYRELFAAHGSALSPGKAAEFLRDPYPREAQSFAYPSHARGATICRDITSWSLVMEPGEGRLWVSDTEIPGCQGPFFAFDLPARQRLPGLDLAPTGYQSALECAQQFVTGNMQAAQASLAQAISLDGPTAPHMLVQAILHGLAGEETQAAECLGTVAARWPGTAMATLAQTWLSGQSDPELRPIPYPSAISPVVYLRPALSWTERAVAAR